MGAKVHMTFGAQTVGKINFLFPYGDPYLPSVAESLIKTTN